MSQQEYSHSTIPTSTMDFFVDLLPRETSGQVSANLILFLNNFVATGKYKSDALCYVSFIKELRGAKTQNWLARPRMATAPIRINFSHGGS